MTYEKTREELCEIIGNLSFAILNDQTSKETDMLCRKALDKLRDYRDLLDKLNMVSKALK